MATTNKKSKKKVAAKKIKKVKKAIQSKKPKKSLAKKSSSKNSKASKAQPKKASKKSVKPVQGASKGQQKRPMPSKSTPAKATLDLASFAPLNDHILIQPDGASDKTPGGLFIPATVKDRPLQGLVLAVGKGAFNKKGQQRPLDVRVGERVLYGQYAGTQVNLKGQELLILREEDVLGVTKND